MIDITTLTKHLAELSVDAKALDKVTSCGRQILIVNTDYANAVTNCVSSYRSVVEKAMVTTFSTDKLFDPAAQSFQEIAKDLLSHSFHSTLSAVPGVDASLAGEDKHNPFCMYSKKASEGKAVGATVEDCYIRQTIRGSGVFMYDQIERKPAELESLLRIAVISGLSDWIKKAELAHIPLRKPGVTIAKVDIHGGSPSSGMITDIDVLATVLVRVDAYLKQRKENEEDNPGIIVPDGDPAKWMRYTQLQGRVL